MHVLFVYRNWNFFDIDLLHELMFYRKKNRVSY